MLKKFGPFRLPALLPNGGVEDFDVFLFRSGKEFYSVLVKGDVFGKQNVLVRVHSACSLGNVFHSQRCDCGEQLENAMGLVAKEGGLIIYAWGQEGRGIGIEKHVLAYMKQDEGFDTVDAFLELGLPVDKRDYSACANI